MMVSLTFQSKATSPFCILFSDCLTTVSCGSEMKYWFLLLFIQPGLSSITIRKFESSTDGEIAYDVIDKSTPLPERFTLCSTFRENLIYEYNSIFTIYGQSGKSWMTLGQFTSDHIELWVRINKKWRKVTDLPEHWMNTWIHVCLTVDTPSGNFSAFINEIPPLSFNEPGLALNTPKNLKEKLYVGKTEDFQGVVKQYMGEVANVNIFSGVIHFENLLERSCDHEGDIVHKGTEWKRIGNVREIKQDNWKICYNYEIYRVVIPTKINWDSSRELCHKLGEGSITEPQNERDIADVVSLLENMNSTCKTVWTSISDEEVEGEFRSSETGKLITFLPWNDDQPNGRRTQNHVGLDVKPKLFRDVHRSKQYCSACDLNKTLVVTLIGGCEDTPFGKKGLFLN